MPEFLELIDARRKNWLQSLEQALSARRAVFLIAPGNAQSLRLLKDLLDVSLGDHTSAHDVLTLYEQSERFDGEDYDRLCQAHLEGNFVLLIEEFYQPRTHLPDRQIAVACNVVRRIARQHPAINKSQEGPDSDSAGSGGTDFMEVEVFLGHLAHDFAALSERVSSKPASQLPAIESATFHTN